MFKAVLKRIEKHFENRLRAELGEEGYKAMTDCNELIAKCNKLLNK